MKTLSLAALAILLCTTARAALTPPAEAFLVSIGLNPQSEEVLAAEAEGVIATMENGDYAEFSLEERALAKRKNGVLAFIHTRKFIGQLKENFAGTSIPTVNYDPLYLTVEERALVGRKFAERFKKK